MSTINNKMKPKQKKPWAGRGISVQLICFLSILLTVAQTNLANAQQASTLQAGKDLGNLAYATFLGTGIYSAEGRSVQVYHIPISYHLRNLKKDDWGLKLKFPVTLGFFDFRAIDIIEEGFPEDISTFSFVPGVEYQFRANDQWRLMPYIDLGLSTVVSEDVSAYVYSTGIKSYFDFTAFSHDFILFNKLFYAGYTHTDRDISDDFAALETGLDVKFNWNVRMFQRDTYASLYWINYLYFDDLRFFRYLAEPDSVDKQNELGVTIGFNSRDRLWMFDLETARIGIGYRFGDNLDVIRIVFGLPF